MSLNILTISPNDGKNDVTIDTGIVIEFDSPIDPFSLVNGLNLFVKSEGLWSGPGLSQLDTKYSDVLDIGETDTFYPLKYQVIGNTVEIMPIVSLIPDREHYLCIYPGNDSSRYISKTTVGSPIVVSDMTNTISITSSYTGQGNDIFEISFTSSNGEDIDGISILKGIHFLGDFPFVSDEEVDIGELRFILTGTFDILDSITIPVYAAVGVDIIYQIKFTTSKYETSIPKSHKIEYFGDSDNPLQVIKTIPEDVSFNNHIINPITFVFNKTIKEDQNILDNIKIKRTQMDTGTEKNIKHYYRINGNTIKIYMLSSTNTPQ